MTFFRFQNRFLDFLFWIFLMTVGASGEALALTEEAATTVGAGDLDTSFGTDGLTTTSYGSSTTASLVGFCLTTDDSGNIVQTGRYSDLSSGSDTASTVPILATSASGPLTASSSSANPMAILYNSSGEERDFTSADRGGSNESYIGCGTDSENRVYGIGQTNKNGTNDILIVRYGAMTEGDFGTDTTFQSSGVLIQDLGSSEDVVGGIVTGDDLILVAGTTDKNGTSDFFIARFDSSGNLDTTFGTDYGTDGTPDGYTVTDFNSDDDTAYGLAVNRVGEIAVVGSTSDTTDDVAIAFYNAEGVLETKFDADGKATIDVASSSDGARAVSFTTTGFVLVGNTDAADMGDMFLMRYNYNSSRSRWTRDSSFGGDGIADFSITSDTDSARALIADAAGNLLVSGASTSSAGSNWFVARFDRTGDLDVTFDDDGIMVWDGATASIATNLYLTSDNGLLVGGTILGSPYEAFLARIDNSYCGDGAIDTGEDCDDGNNTNGDDCSARCVTESTEAESDCSDDADNDGDGTTDCDDSDCSSNAACGGTTTSETNCTNSSDDDGDGATDCDDTDCSSNEICGATSVESDCSDDADNDGDGATDCDDTDCSSNEICGAASVESDCSNGSDDDGDGAVDCDDSDCAADSACATSAETDCSDTTDDDGDGATDCDDSDCAAASACLTPNPSESSGGGGCSLSL